jgi:hypothetical protein
MNATGFYEPVDRRVLGGFVFVDAITSDSVVGSLTASSTQLQLKVNKSGIYAIFNAPGFSDLTNQFLPASWPTTTQAQNFEVTVQDPSLRYLPRRVQVKTPQPLPVPGNPPSLQKIQLYPSPSAILSPNWAVVRVSVTDTSGLACQWALVELIKSDSSVAATGMTDARGEALLAVAGLGLQVSKGASGSITETTIPITIQAWFDPSVRTQPKGWVPDPDTILGSLTSAALKTGKTSGTLGPSMIFSAAITISV